MKERTTDKEGKKEILKKERKEQKEKSSRDVQINK
jgi:hypothetical protein